jgi:hypothetical protein
MGFTNITAVNGGNGMPTPEVPPKAEMPSRADLDPLIKRANAGDDDALEQLREVFDQWPEIWQQVGDLARACERKLVTLLAGDSRYVQEAVARKAEALRLELLGDDASPLERLVVEQVVISWMELHFLQIKLAGDGGNTLTFAKYSATVKAEAQRRFDTAMKSLLLVREKLPAIRYAERPRLRVRRSG